MTKNQKPINKVEMTDGKRSIVSAKSSGVINS